MGKDIRETMLDAQRCRTDCSRSPRFTSQILTVPSVVAAQNANPHGKNMAGYLSLLEGKPCVYVWTTMPESKLYRSYPPSLAVDITCPFGESELPSLVEQNQPASMKRSSKK